MSQPAATTLEAQIEAAWCALVDTRRTRRFYLTAGGRLLHGASEEGVHVGHYTRAVTLAQFREDVFAAFDELKGVGNGR